MKLHQNFTQSPVDNVLQIPEMGKIPFLSSHTALSSINIHMIAVTKANLLVTQGPLAHVWVFPLTPVLAHLFDQSVFPETIDMPHHS